MTFSFSCKLTIKGISLFAHVWIGFLRQYKKLRTGLLSHRNLKWVLITFYVLNGRSHWSTIMLTGLWLEVEIDWFLYWIENHQTKFGYGFFPNNLMVDVVLIHHFQWTEVICLWIRIEDDCCNQRIHLPYVLTGLDAADSRKRTSHSDDSNLSEKNTSLK